MSNKLHSEIASTKISLCTDNDEDNITINNREKLFSKAYSKFTDFRQNNLLCDVAIIVENKKIHAHKVILASSIPYFKMMFTNDMVEATKREVSIQELDFETLSHLINYAYTGKLTITTCNVQSLMIGANFLQLTYVVKKCADFLQNRLHASNVLAIRNFCLAIGCTGDILEKTDAFIQKHFIAVSKSLEFVEMDIEEVCKIFEENRLYIDSEKDVFEAAIRWIQHDERRQEKAARLLACVRLPLLKPSFISDEVASHPILKSNLACRDLIDEAKDYHLMPERRQLMKSFSVTPRQCDNVPGLLFAVGGFAKTPESDEISSVEMYDPLTKLWTSVEKMPTNRTRVGVAAARRELYTIGGYNGIERMRTVEVFEFERNTWRTTAPLLHRRSALSAIFLHDKLYVAGGYDGISSLNSVEIYDSEKNSWSYGPSMLRQRSAAGIAVLDGFIYVLGGHDGSQIFNSVERLNLEKDEWESFPPMLSRRCRLGAAVYKGKLYACGGYDGTQFLKSCEVFDLQTMKWSYISPMNLNRSRVALAANVDALYAVAGYDGMDNLASVEVYNEERDTWEMAPPLIHHEGGISVAVLPIPPNLLSSSDYNILTTR